MPSKEKRINLTIPKEIYELLQAYKKRNNFTCLGDATLCLAIIEKQVREWWERQN